MGSSRSTSDEVFTAIISEINSGIMSWLFRGRSRRVKGVGKPAEGESIISTIHLVVKLVGEDVEVYGRARSKRDLDRLKRISQEVLEEILGEHEGKSASPASPRRFRKQH